MQFYNHYNLAGKHAFLGASKSSWLRYDEAKLQESYRKAQAAALGTRLHELAAEHIQLGLPFGEPDERDPLMSTVAKFVNDAISYKMSPETVLYYSEYAFGTADAISFDEDSEFLRIHDLKTVVFPPFELVSLDHESSLSSNIMIQNPLNRFFDIVSN